MFIHSEDIDQVTLMLRVTLITLVHGHITFLLVTDGNWEKGAQV